MIEGQQVAAVQPGKWRARLAKGWSVGRRNGDEMWQRLVAPADKPDWVSPMAVRRNICRSKTYTWCGAKAPQSLSSTAAADIVTE